MLPCHLLEEAEGERLAFHLLLIAEMPVVRPPKVFLGIRFRGLELGLGRLARDALAAMRKRRCLDALRELLERIMS